MDSVQVRENIPLKPYNTFGIAATAKQFAVATSVDKLREILKKHRSLPLLVLGGGSNVLFTRSFDGLVVKNNLTGIEVVGEEGDFVYVKAGAGEGWHRFVQYCLENNFAGVENLSLIPGNVGASPMQNIGAYGVEIKDVFEELEALEIATGQLRIFSLAECHFGYRESVFKKELKNQFIITSVTYKLRKTPLFNTSYGAIQQELDAMGVKELSIQAISQAVINIRTSKLPDWKVVGNAGSFFKNPQVTKEKYAALKEDYPTLAAYPQNDGMKLAAGWLIEQCGWKGFREGDAGCYPKQALVLVNYGTATGDQIFKLSERIIGSVQEKFGVTLEREVNIL